MKRISSPQSLQREMLKLKGRKVIGFVPTMGFLHEGHLSLVKRAQKKSDMVVVSLFVNPTQFNDKKDFQKYPQDRKRDLQKLRDLGVDYVFTPTAKDMYPEGAQTTVQVGEVSHFLCGASRPGHFDGVATVVCKLFQIVQPDLAVFGRKDFQQLLVIQQMVKDLNLPVKIDGAPLVREPDGLAMSSRNARLSAKQRVLALGLSRGLMAAKAATKGRAPTLKELQRIVRAEIPKVKSVKIDYLAFCDAKTLRPLKSFKRGQTLVALAVQVGPVRLIDNVLL